FLQLTKHTMAVAANIKGFDNARILYIILFLIFNNYQLNVVQLSFDRPFNSLQSRGKGLS
ncbi:MAG: hypothetical protein ABJC98_04775, partial [Bacteroidota bacterium]